MQRKILKLFINQIFVIHHTLFRIITMKQGNYRPLLI